MMKNLKKSILIFLISIVFCPLFFVMILSAALGGGYVPEGGGMGGEIIEGSEISPYGFVLPVPEYIVNSPFGNRPGLLDGFHKGTDFDCNMGDPILALDDGMVTYTGFDTYGAQLISIRFDSAAALYAHMSATYVKAGQSVERGEVIAACGSTGYSTGPHLHIEIKVNGVYRDPEKYLPKKGYSSIDDEKEETNQ